MVDIKWFKFEVNMHDDTKLKIIDNMDERDSVHYMWIRLLALAGKTNCGGNLYINDNMPYTIKTLAIEFNRSIDEVKTAIKALKRLEMIEFTEDKAFKIKNWDKHQNVEGLERLRNLNSDRVAKHRAKKKEKNEDVNNVASELGECKKPIENNNEETNHNGNLVEEENASTNVIEQVVEAKDNIDDSINKNKEIATRQDSNIDHIKENEDIETKESINYSGEANEFFEKTHYIDNFDNSSLKEDLGDNADNNINGNCNVTSNDITSSCNITVMEQKKKEKENKKKMESKKEIESKLENKKKIESVCGSNKAVDLNNKGLTHEEEVKQANISKGKNHKADLVAIAIGENAINVKADSVAIAENDINSKAMELLTHYEKITGIIGGLNFGSLRLAIEMHGGKPVEMAINRALEVNKHDMPYINGILKNWRREGYPKEGDEINNGVRSTGKSKPADKNEFAGFKPKKPRNLTEAERKRAEEKLI